MEMIEALKTLYGDTCEKIIYTDENLMVIWTNVDDIPKILPAENFRFSRYDVLALPVEHKTICRYITNDKSYTVMIKPVSDTHGKKGCLITLLDEHEVDRLAMQSTLSDRIRNDLDAVRFEAGSMFNLLNIHKKVWSEKSENDYTEFDSESREKILGILSATANYEEISIYLGGVISSEMKFVSVMLEDISERIKVRADKFGYRFVCNIESMVHLESNTQRFEAAVANLVVNAYKYNSKQDKECVIDLSSDGKKAVISVTDNGDGISPEMLEKLRDPFGYFSDESLSESLGLTVAMLYCDRFGGKLEIESEVGKYTKVSMIFDDPGKEVPRDFRQYRPPVNYAFDKTGCILGKVFGYFGDIT